MLSYLRRDFFLSKFLIFKLMKCDEDEMNMSIGYNILSIQVCFLMCR